HRLVLSRAVLAAPVSLAAIATARKAACRSSERRHCAAVQLIIAIETTACASLNHCRKSAVVRATGASWMHTNAMTCARDQSLK
ncbi:hypothetical protein Dimus_015803, partial [Dionaea muscipula]